MRTKNMDLLEKLSRKTKEKIPRNLLNKRILGVSIEKIPEIIDSRETLGNKIISQIKLLH